MRRLRELIQGRGGMLLPLTLILAVVISALAVVRTKHENRGLVNELTRPRGEGTSRHGMGAAAA